VLAERETRCVSQFICIAPLISLENLISSTADKLPIPTTCPLTFYNFPHSFQHREILGHFDDVVKTEKLADYPPLQTPVGMTFNWLRGTFPRQGIAFNNKLRQTFHYNNQYWSIPDELFALYTPMVEATEEITIASTLSEFQSSYATRYGISVGYGPSTISPLSYIPINYASNYNVSLTLFFYLLHISCSWTLQRGRKCSHIVYLYISAYRRDV